MYGGYASSGNVCAAEGASGSAVGKCVRRRGRVGLQWPCARCWNADFAARGNLHGRPHLSYLLLEYVHYVPQTFAVRYKFIVPG